jgi:pilus assembly protein CpaE
LKKSLDILLLTTDKEIASVVQTAVEGLATEVTVSLCRDVAEFKTRLVRSMADPGDVVAVVDVDQDPKRVLYELSRVTRTSATMPCVVVSRQFSEDLVLQAMQAGARHFLRKGSIAGELGAVVGHLIVQDSDTEHHLGDVISVFSSGGGCGATTAAVNLAQELCLASAKPTVVVDLDEYYGAVAPHLGVTGRYGVGHILARQGTIDKHLIETTMVRSDEGVDVLLSPAMAEADAGVPLTYENLLRMLDACRESHNYVIVDAPRIPLAAMAELASISRIAVVVFQLTVRDIRRAKAIVDFLIEQEMDRDRILPLANRVGRRGPLLSLRDGRQVLGMDLIYQVRNQWRKAVKSMNQGLPLSRAARRSGLRRDYRRIAGQLRRWTTNGD